MTIAEKYAQQYQHNGEVSLADLIQAALDEQAETHALELRAYEATAANLEQRIRQIEAQRVPEKVECGCGDIYPASQFMCANCLAAVGAADELRRVDEAQSVPVEDVVLPIASAYESGVGHCNDSLCNPYKAGSAEAYAYDYGKEFGKSRGISQSVPVVGEPVAWGVTKRYEDNVWFISDSRFTAQHYANQYAHRIGAEPDQVVIPLFDKPTHSIPAAELATLREKAAMVDELRKDAERYRWLRMKGAHSDAVDKVHMFGPQLDRAIDAAIAQGKGE